MIYFYEITLLSCAEHTSNKPLFFRFCFLIFSLSLSASVFSDLIELLISEYDLCSNAGSRSQCTVESLMQIVKLVHITNDYIKQHLTQICHVTELMVSGTKYTALWNIYPALMETSSNWETKIHMDIMKMWFCLYDSYVATMHIKARGFQLMKVKAKSRL